jgi:hypothetical protein
VSGCHIAAYVAARTPTALDKHVFKHGRGDEATGKRRKASVMQMDRRTEQAKARALAGPVGFTLERLLAIMQTLVRDAALDAVGDSAARDEQLSADVFMQVHAVDRAPWFGRESAAPVLVTPSATSCRENLWKWGREGHKAR